MSEDMEDMGEIIQDFLLEADELLEELDEDLVTLENSKDDSDLLNKIFRAFHTIKGSSSFLGFEKLTELTHKLEDILNKLRKFEITLNSDMMDAILSGIDKLKEIIELIKSGSDPESVDIEDNIKALMPFLDSNAATEAENGTDKNTKEDSNEIDFDEMIKEQEEEIKEEEIKEEESAMEQEQQTEVEVGENQDTSNTESKKGKDSDIEDEIARLLQQRMEEDRKRRQERKKQNEQKKSEVVKSKATGSNAKKAKVMPEQTIRVDVNRLDDLMNLVGELVLGKNRLTSVAQKVEDKFQNDDVVEELLSVSGQIMLVTTDLQMGVMKTRMVQVGKVFNKFPRVVRDLSREVDKDIELVIEGAETELDKSVVEEINDPLVHLIRNAVDHGIETREERSHTGKPPKGKIVLSAYHEGNYIIISVKDDGRGMDPEILKNKAIEKGLITETEARQMSNEEAYGLIFKPGFSTAKSVSNISGRGVGMDVVKTNIEKLNGTIEIKSELGKGSAVTLKIPLTLAIIQALLVKIAKEYFAIPLVSVVETVRITKAEIKKVENRDVLKLRGNIIPLVYLGDTLGIGKNKKMIDGKEIYVVVVSVAEKKIGIVVDKLIGREEIVIKSLGNYLPNIRSISGATIRGDGSVTLILDVPSVVEEASKVKSNISDHLIDNALEKKEKPSCLVVSPDKSVRNSIKTRMISEGFDVFESHNSKEALDISSEEIFDIIFADLEMPISGGYEFTKLLRDFAAYRNTMIVGISKDGTFDKEKMQESRMSDVVFTPIEEKDINRILEIVSKKIKVA